MALPPFHPFISAAAREQYLDWYDRRAQGWPVASETKTAETFYGTTFLRISGPPGAPPLVLLPGAASTSLMWWPNIEALSEHFRTYALDNIYDHGRSVSRRPIKGPGDFVNWLDDLFRSLDFRNPIRLMGMSYGGWLASQYALVFPERLERLVLLAPGATVLRIRVSFLIRAVLCALPVRCITRNMMFWLFADFARKDATSRAILEATVDDMRMAARCFKPRRPVIPTVLDDREWQRIRIPTLFLVGEHEKIYSAQKAVRRLNRVAPAIKTDVIPGAGHDLTVVQAELVNRKVLAFLIRA